MPPLQTSRCETNPHQQPTMAEQVCYLQINASLCFWWFFDLLIAFWFRICRLRRLIWSNPKCFYGYSAKLSSFSMNVVIMVSISMLVNVYFFLWSSKISGKGKRPGKGGNRFWKSVGLGFKTPRDAIEGLLILNLWILCDFDIHVNVISLYSFSDYLLW